MHFALLSSGVTIHRNYRCIAIVGANMIDASLLVSKRDLLASNRDLLVSNRDLLVSKRLNCE